MVRIVVTEPTAGAADGIRRKLPAEDFEIVGYARDGLEAAQLALQLTPDVLIVHEQLPELSGYRVAELVSAATTDIGVLLLVAQETEQVLRRALSAGARAVLTNSANPDRLAEAIDRVAEFTQIRQEPEYPMVTDPERMPVTVGVTAARGGAGKTTVAVNLAVLFAQQFANDVALVDCQSQFGDVSVALDLTPKHTIADLAAFDELDKDLVYRHLAVHEPSGLRVLPAPELPLGEDVDMGRLNVDFAAALIGQLRRSFRFVFFDAPALSWPMSQYLFSRCQHILVVTNLWDLAALRNSRSLMQITEKAVGDEHRVKLIVNQLSSKGDFDLEDLEQTIGRTAYAQLPDAGNLAAMALNEGIPVVMRSSGSALGKALAGLADKLYSELCPNGRQ